MEELKVALRVNPGTRPAALFVRLMSANSVGKSAKVFYRHIMRCRRERDAAEVAHSVVSGAGAGSQSVLKPVSAASAAAAAAAAAEGVNAPG